MKEVTRLWPLVVAIAAAASIGCSDSDPAGTGSGGAGGAGGAGGEGGGGGSRPECVGGGVSKGPWALAADESGVTLRWESCKANTPGDVVFALEGGGPEQTAPSVEAAFEVKHTYKAALNPNVSPDWAGTWYMHEAVLSGLTPGSCYQYHLEADPARKGRFCSARPSGSPFSFMAIADTNPGLGDTTSHVLASALPRGPEFVIHAGDVQYYDSGLETWAFWFDKMQPMLSQGAFFPTVGNHESENEDEYSDYFTRYFVAPAGGGQPSYHHFTTGGVHFFALDSEQDLSLGSLQGTWLSAELEAASASVGFISSVVYLHKPLVTCGDTSSNGPVREQLAPLFLANGVALVIQAHMHGYERFDLDGLTYITTGGGGGAIGDVDENKDRPECASRLASGAFFHALLVDVVPGEVHTTAIDDAGMVRDEAVIVIP